MRCTPLSPHTTVLLLTIVWSSPVCGDYYSRFSPYPILRNPTCGPRFTSCPPSLACIPNLLLQKGSSYRGIISELGREFEDFGIAQETPGFLLLENLSARFSCFEHAMPKESTGAHLLAEGGGFWTDVRAKISIFWRFVASAIPESLNGHSSYSVGVANTL